MKITVQKEIREEKEVELPLYLDLGESDDLRREYRKITEDKTVILTIGWGSVEFSVLSYGPIVKEHWLGCQITEQEWNDVFEDAKEITKEI